MSMDKEEKLKEKVKIRENSIREVYEDNFVEEIKNMSLQLEKFNYVALDTEFPGVIYQSTANNRDPYYKTIKANVDKLKLIQVGITLSDEYGNFPPEVSTWQFNLKFDLKNDLYSSESIALLSSSGINFELLENRGISHEMFGEYMITSGLLLSENIFWICFHGIYDFAYFLKLVTNVPLPETEILFFETLKIYFSNYYDIRHLVRYNDSFRGSLSRLGQELNILRVGSQHQAGSDSLLTSEIFFRLKREYLTDESTLNDINILFGILIGEETDNLSYQNNGYLNSSLKYNNNQNSQNYAYDYSNLYQQQNMINMQYNYLRNNPNYFQNLTNMNNLPSVGNINNFGTYFTYNGYNKVNMQFPMNNTFLNNNSNIRNNTLNQLSEKTKKQYNLKGTVED